MGVRGLEIMPAGIIDSAPLCARVGAGNTDFGNDAADSNKFHDPQLQLLIERWPTLSKAVQQQIMLLVG